MDLVGSSVARYTQMNAVLGFRRNPAVDSSWGSCENCTQTYCPGCLTLLQLPSQSRNGRGCSHLVTDSTTTALASPQACLGPLTTSMRMSKDNMELWSSIEPISSHLKRTLTRSMFNRCSRLLCVCDLASASSHPKVNTMLFLSAPSMTRTCCDSCL